MLINRLFNLKIDVESIFYLIFATKSVQPEMQIGMQLPMQLAMQIGMQI